MFGIIVVGGAVLAYIVLLMLFDKVNFFAAIPAANTHGLVITKPNTVVKDKDGKITGVKNDGGRVTRVVHAIPGKVLNTDDPDPMEWHYEKETRQQRERRGLHFILLGIEIIGLFRYMRTNDIRIFRYGRGDKDKKYEVLPKDQHTRFPYFSGQHDVLAEGIETKGTLKLRFLINILYEETYPVRVRLYTADPFAVMSMMVTRRIISFAGSREPFTIIEDESVKDELMKVIREDLAEVKKNLGLTIKEVTPAEIDFDPETRKLLERQITADIEAKARIRESEGQRDAQINLNLGYIHRLENLLIPASENETRARVFQTDRMATAHETNKTTTTLVLGSGATPVVSVGKP